MRYYEKACEYGFPRGCSIAGIIHLEGRGVEKNTEKGVSYLQQACDQDRADPCAVLGTAHLLGLHGVSKDISKAVSLLGKGCDLGSIQACVNLSRLYKTGDGIPRNDALAQKYKDIAIKIKQEIDGVGNAPGVKLGRTA